MVKQIIFENEARERFLEGINKVARAVGITLGPKGRNVIIEKKFGNPVVTNDGISIAKEVELEDPFENMGAQVAKEAASKTNDVAGDGTTTAVILTQKMVSEGLKAVAAGGNPMLLKKGIQIAVDAVSNHLDKMSRPVKGRKDIEHIATISGNNDSEIGALIAEAIDKVGNDGVITIEDSKTGLTSGPTYVEGMQFDRGFQSPYFANDREMQNCELEDVMILIYESKISNVQELLPVLERVAGAGNPLVVLSEECEGEVLATLVVNRLKGILRVAAVKAPGYGDRRKAMLQDIAILTGGEFISKDLGIKLENVQIEQLGRAAKIKITKDDTTIIGGKGAKSKIKGRIDSIRAELEDTDSDWEREKLQERLAKLAGGVAEIKVGAPTEVEMKEKKHRFEDALSATRAAAEEGIVPGGGVALLRAGMSISDLSDDDENINWGISIVRNALAEPTRRIAANAGHEGAVVVQKVRSLKGANGLNAMTGEYEDLVKAGIIDPLVVTRSALQNAASVAGMVLTTEVMIADKPEKEADAGGGMSGGMPGMM
ncbi:chaperonin GroEL [bacterium]|nr:chaperonin GroEL [bacterium]